MIQFQSQLRLPWAKCSDHLSWKMHIKKPNCVLTRFYSSTLRKTVMSTGSHVSLQTGTSHKLDNWAIIRINILTKIYGDMAKNVTSREFTRFHYSHIKTIASCSSGYVFWIDIKISKLDWAIIWTNIRPKCMKIGKKTVTSLVFKRFHYSYIRKTAQPCYIRSFMKFHNCCRTLNSFLDSNFPLFFPSVQLMINN